MKTVFLVSCVSKKANSVRRAEELYQSDWFKKARCYVLQTSRPGDRWFILSAQHHLVEPCQLLAPYERTLLKMKQRDRRSWADSVLAELGGVLTSGDEVVMLAGEPYREFLEPALVSQGYDVKVPMRGLVRYRQIAWLLNAIKRSDEAR